MYPYRFKTNVALFQLGEDILFAETLRWCEMDGIDDDTESLLKELYSTTQRVVAEHHSGALSKRTLPETLETSEITFSLAPPGRSMRWQKPVEMRFDLVLWRHPACQIVEPKSTASLVKNANGDLWIGHLPWLGVSVLASSRDAIKAKAERHAREVLALRRSTRSLANLIPLCRPQSMTLHTLEHEIDLRTPSEVAREYHREEKVGQKEIFQQLGIDQLDSRHMPEAFEVEASLRRLADFVTLQKPASVLMIGPSGVGKTAIWHELVRRAHDFSLANVPFWETSPVLLTSRVGDYCDWRKRCDQILKLTSKLKPVVHLGNLWELSQVGMYEGQHQSVADYLAPRIARGEIAVVCECDAQQLAIIERDRPNLLQPFSRMEINEPSLTEATIIYHEVATKQYHCDVTDAAIERLDSLHRRYATNSAAPARPLLFLENLIDAKRFDHREGGLPKNNPAPISLDTTDITTAFSRETGLPLFLLDERIPFDAEKAAAWFSRQVIGQDQTIQIVVDLLAMVKARLAREDRPIASLLFVGPTGVGKTELAKMLAKYLYSDPQRMVRIDMSEYAEPTAAERLIRGGTDSEGILTARVRQQPFGVVLLDEFEKAHPNVFDLLLQILGEGRLTDAAGRLADFRNSVIILTSNLGVERFGKNGIGFGDNDPSLDAVKHFTSEAAKLLRPELLGRIDRVVPFAPLSTEVLRKITERQIEQIQRRHGLATRDVQMEVDDAVYDTIVRHAYDPRYGARPILRAVEQLLLTPLVQELSQCDPRKTTHVQAFVKKNQVRVRATSSNFGKTTQNDQLAWREVTDRLARLRLKCRHLLGHHFVSELRSHIQKAKSIERKCLRQQKQPTTEEQKSIYQSQNVYQKLFDRIEKTYHETVEAEHRRLLAFYQDREESESAGLLPEMEQAYHNVCEDLYRCDQSDELDLVSLALYSKEAQAIKVMCDIYRDIAKRRNDKLQVYELYLCETEQHLDQVDEQQDLTLASAREETLLPEIRELGFNAGHREFFRRHREKMQVVHAYHLESGSNRPALDTSRRKLGRWLIMRGDMTGLYFAKETGIHRLKSLGPNLDELECSVQAWQGEPSYYFPPINEKGIVQIANNVIRRVIDYTKKTLRDPIIAYNQSWVAPTASEAVNRCLNQAFRNEIDEWLQ